MKTKSPYIYIYIYNIVAFSVINILPFGSLTAATTVDESLCNKHYEVAIRLRVDTPTIHYFSVSKDATTGKEGRVVFSSGNLQYCPSYQHIVPTATGQRLETIPNVFRFAPRQIDRIADGGDTYPKTGNVWYDTIIKVNVPSILGGDSFYAERRKCTNSKNVALCTPNGITNAYHGWIDLYPWGSSCRGKRARDPFATQFQPYEYSTTNTGNTSNPYGIGPSYYASPSTNNPVGWQTDIKRNNIDTNSGASRFFDWGYVNIIREYTPCTQIVNGETVHTMDSTMYRMGMWRTLTAEEWDYLLFTRKVENSTDSWSICCVEDTSLHATGDNRYIRGILIYPDDYNSTLVNAPNIARGAGTFKSGTRSVVTYEVSLPHGGTFGYDQTYIYDYDKIKVPTTDFTRYQEVGCAFLPETWGVRDIDVTHNTGGVSVVDFDMSYWSSMVVNTIEAYYATPGFGYVKKPTPGMNYGPAISVTHPVSQGFNNKFSKMNGLRTNACGVRLVQDIQ